MLRNEKPDNSCGNPGGDDTPGQVAAGPDAALLKTAEDVGTGRAERAGR
jgi:hypothetical protein